jgi:CheY-like chemotaxis protein
MSSRVLVIDDDPRICELIHEVLESVEIDSLTFTRSTQALQQLATEKFDAVFLDVRMPAPDGIELTRQIRSGGLNVSTPIMVITGEDERALLTRAFDAGANFFLYKPVDRQSILRFIRTTQDSIDQERRRFRRIRVCRKVAIECGAVRATGSTLDLSVGGMFVQSTAPFQIGALVRVSVDLGSGPPLNVSARVLRVAGDGCIGMQFENIAAAQTKRLQDFLLPLIVAK